MKKADRQLIFDKYGGRCAYCGCELKKGWHVDHLEAVHRESEYSKETGKYVLTGVCRHPENDHFDNYMPSCASCNITKSTVPLESFRRYIENTVESLNKNHYAAYKFAKRFGLIQETPKEVKFYFETLNTETKN